MTFPPRISARFEIVTPMFLGDAQQQATRISEASVKGALVFWWRALNYAGFVAAAKVAAEKDVQKAALKAMQTHEQALFGGAKRGQSAVLLKVRHLSGLPRCAKGEKLTDDTNAVVGTGARYLGYGLMGAFGENAGKLDRSCFTGGSFSVDLIFRKSHLEVAPDKTDADKTDAEPIDVETIDVARNVTNAIKAFGLLGGLGARKRRGWGSVALLSLEGAGEWTPPATRDNYIEKVKEVIGEQLPVQSGSDFPLTAFANETDIRVGTGQNANALSVLNDLGGGFQRYRAWGHAPNGKTVPEVGGNPSEKNFKDDHDWYKKLGKFSGGRGNYVPARTSFGLPHNYAQKFGVTANGDHDRRASPLLFHIHRAGTQYFAVALYFPVQFLPENNASVWEGKQDKGHKTPHNFSYDPDVIKNFLNGTRQAGSGASPKYFPSTKVFP